MTAKLSTAELKALLAGITPGDWHLDENTVCAWSIAPSVAKETELVVADIYSAVNSDARAIAQVPALLAEVIELRDLLTKIVNGIDYERGAGEGVDHQALLIATRAALAASGDK